MTPLRERRTDDSNGTIGSMSTSRRGASITLAKQRNLGFCPFKWFPRDKGIPIL